MDNDKKIKLLNVITSMDPVNGGPSQGIRNLNKPLLKLGVIREVVCLDAPDAAYLGADDFKIHAIGPAKGPWCYSPNLMIWLNENLSRFDVVCVNGLWLFPSYAAWKALKKSKSTTALKQGPPMLVMPHGMLDPYFQRASGRKLKAIRNWLYWKLIEHKVVNDADGVLFTCQTELLLARETFRPYTPKKEYNVSYGIPEPQPYTQEHAEAFNKVADGLNGSPYILFLSRIHQKKGIDLLIEAYANLHSKFKAEGKLVPKLVIAGPGIDSAFGKTLLQLLKNIPEVEADVIFTGMLQGNAKWGAIYGCEAFVLPSHQENFGIAVVEALACCKPVLISNQVNIWTEIDQEGAGIISEDTLQPTQSSLEKWFNLPAGERRTMQQCALNAYQKHFSNIPAAQFFADAISDAISAAN